MCESEESGASAPEWARTANRTRSRSGLMKVENGAIASDVIGRALRSGWMLIGEGEDGNVLTLSPALNVSDAILDAAVDRIAELLGA